jgi:hypothetical protein
MNDLGEEIRISLWYGNTKKDVLSIQQWLSNVQEAKGK